MNRKRENDRGERSKSPTPECVSEHYSSGYEENRLLSGAGKLECARSRELLTRLLPPAPAVVLDVGGGPGAYACWLAKRGYEVHLIDIVPLHVELAAKASLRQPDTPLASIEIGDACALERQDGSVDAVLMFGPLYHLTDRQQRILALKEALRVIRKGGVLLAVGISRFASALDGLRSRFLEDPSFFEIVMADLRDGQHRNPTENPDYFMDTFFHHPDELQSEVKEAGFGRIEIFGVEGPGWLAPDFDDWWRDEDLRSRLLAVARLLETERGMLGTSAHMMVAASKDA